VDLILHGSAFTLNPESMFAFETQLKQHNYCRRLNVTNIGQKFWKKCVEEKRFFSCFLNTVNRKLSTFGFQITPA
jgi:hypothetical protein